MGLDTKANVTLWKDRALIELNHSALYSFQVMVKMFKIKKTKYYSYNVILFRKLVLLFRIIIHYLTNSKNITKMNIN